VDIAENLVVEELADDVVAGQEEGPQRFGAEHAPCGGTVGDFPRFHRVERDRLLHDDVPPRVEGEQGVGALVVVRGGDVDDVDRRIGDDVLPGCAGAGRR
jgi:hypothetical protein